MYHNGKMHQVERMDSIQSMYIGTVCVLVHKSRIKKEIIRSYTVEFTQTWLQETINIDKIKQESFYI